MLISKDILHTPSATHLLLEKIQKFSERCLALTGCPIFPHLMKAGHTITDGKSNILELDLQTDDKACRFSNSVPPEPWGSTIGQQGLCKETKSNGGVGPGSSALPLSGRVTWLFQSLG